MGLNRKGIDAPWQAAAKNRMAAVDREMEQLNPRWSRMAFSTKALFVENAQRCYEEDPVTFAHFEAVVLALVTARMSQ